jgi:eukaryotic-like serine/threonine-protein kinase
MPLSLSNLYRFDEFVLDPANRSLTRAGAPIPLAAKSLQVLTYLVSNAGRVVTKDELLKAVWPESFVEESNLPGYISGLRKALTDRAGYIATVPGLGYKFTANVELEVPPDLRPQPVANDLRVQQLRETTHVVTRETSILVPSRAARIPILSRWPLWVGIAVVAAGAAIFYGRYLRPEPQELSKVMVGDFLNLTGDPAFDHTLKSSLELSLAQSPYIQLMGAAEEHTALNMMQKAPDSPLLGDLALEVCRRNNYQALLRGNISTGRKWDSDAMSLEVVNCLTGKTITELHADANVKEAVLGTLDGLAVRARRNIGESAASIGEFDVPIMNESTFSFEALQAYNTASNLGSEGKFVECIPYFQKAVDLDPKFAIAQASLGTAYYNLGERQKAAAYSKAAFDLSAGVSQWERFFLRFNYHLMTLHDLDSTLNDLQEWTRVYPRDPTAWQGLGYIEIQLGRYPAAVEATEHSLQLGGIKFELQYENLADAYMRDGRFADAKRVIAEAESEGKDSGALHQLLLEIAFIEHDPQATQLAIAWTGNHPRKWPMLEIRAIMAADLGKERESEALFQQASQDALKEGQGALIDTTMLDEAAVAVDLGEMTRATHILAQIKDHSSANWAVLAAKAGSTTAADAFLKLPNEYPQGTIPNKVLTPELKAVVALRHNDPHTAIALLESSRPYELAYPEVIEVRAEAYLMAKQGAKAQEEYQKLIDHPAIEEPTMPKTILAHLGLARTYAMENRTDESRKEYVTFFSLWKEADADLLVLRQARIEYSQLGNPTTKS